MIISQDSLPARRSPISEITGHEQSGPGIAATTVSRESDLLPTRPPMLGLQLENAVIQSEDRQCKELHGKESIRRSCLTVVCLLR